MQMPPRDPELLRRLGHAELPGDDSTVTVVATRTGEILATNQIDPDKTYWRNTMKAPAAGRRLPTSDL